MNKDNLIDQYTKNEDQKKTYLCNVMYVLQGHQPSD